MLSIVDTMASRQKQRLMRSLVAQERRGLFVAAAVRTTLSLAVLIWQAIDFPFTGWAYAFGLAVPGIFVLLGAAHMAAAWYLVKPLRAAGLLFLIDITCMAALFTTSNPFLGLDIPLYMALRWDNLHWFFVLLAQAAMALNWQLVAWCGLLVGLARIGQLVAVLHWSDAFTEAVVDMQTPAAVLAAYQDVAYVSIGQRFGELLAIAGVTAGLIAVVLRSNRLVMRHAIAERGRVSLARYFSPNTVDALLANDEAWRKPKRQRVVVMFLDIVGFSRMCADQPPEYAVELLKNYHQQLVGQVFAHQGTLDKYIGDGVMITFGTPYTIDKPATHAWDCAKAIQIAVGAWNKDRVLADLTPVLVGCGIHIGDAVIGDIGDQRRLEFAVIGDVVNRSARLEKLTRTEPADIIVSADFYEALRQEGADITELQSLGTKTLRGIEQPDEIFGRPVTQARTQQP